MSAADRKPRKIEKPVQLLVEGTTLEKFFREMLQRLNLGNVEAWDFQSISQLDPFLADFSQRPEFKERVRALGVIRDAEQHPAGSAFASVCASLQKCNFSAPAKMNSMEGQNFKTGIFILPDCEKPGMLETLLLESVADKPETQCIDPFFQCIQERRGKPPANMTKAKVFAYLAAQDLNQPLVGLAARANKWDWESPAFAKLSQFLQALNNA